MLISLIEKTISCKRFLIFLGWLVSTVAHQPSEEDPAMGTTCITSKASILGMTLALLTILLLIAPLPTPHFPWSNPYSPFEFTDVRIVKLDHPISPSDIHGIHRVTIYTEFNLNSPWCQKHDTMALPCPLPLWDHHQGPHEKPLMNHKAIPSL